MTENRPCARTLDGGKTLPLHGFCETPRTRRARDCETDVRPPMLCHKHRGQLRQRAALVLQQQLAAVDSSSGATTLRTPCSASARTCQWDRVSRLCVHGRQSVPEMEGRVCACDEGCTCVCDSVCGWGWGGWTMGTRGGGGVNPLEGTGSMVSVAQSTVDESLRRCHLL